VSSKERVSSQNFCTKHDLEAFEDQRLAPYAIKSFYATRQRNIRSEGRIHDYRTEFQRDRDRILHSRAFRRLKHKTQVFVATEGDHQRTRLTHTLEVSQMARTLCRALSLNEDLAEAIALGHDLGHTPFGHIGEEVLHGIMSGQDDLDGLLDFMTLGNPGGFKHNCQSLRVVDLLEKRYEEDGLNLTDETRIGILRHTSLPDDMTYQAFESKKFSVKGPLFLEAQVVSIADEVAQQAHDMEDGLRAGLVDLEKIERLRIMKEMIRKIHPDYHATRSRFLKQNMLVRGTIHVLLTDILVNSAKKIKEWGSREGIISSEQFYQRLNDFPSDLIEFSRKGKGLFQELKEFVYREIINSYEVNIMDGRAIHFIRNLYKAYYNNPRQLQDWVLLRYAHGRGEAYLRDIPLKEVGRKIHKLQDDPVFLRLISDHIAGMTDKFAMDEYRKLYLP